MDAKTWSTTKTGMVYHSFTANGHAVCHRGIKQPSVGQLLTEAELTARLAEAWGARVRGFSKCEKCTALEQAAADRREASMQPSTGEGDYLPPADEKKENSVTKTQVITEITRTETVTVTVEVAKALRTVRNQPGRTAEEALQLIVEALDTLDNAGVFAAIDEATGYDVSSEPERVLKPCGCANIKQKLGPADSHIQGCKSDPAEYGDLAYVSA